MQVLTLSLISATGYVRYGEPIQIETVAWCIFFYRAIWNNARQALENWYAERHVVSIRFRS